MPDLSPQDAALLELLRLLKARDYRFVAPTPATRRANLRRRTDDLASDLRDVFGWSLPFSDDCPDAEVLTLLRRAGAVRRTRAGERSTVRVASLGSQLFLHGPGADDDEPVFFGPDSYRFARFVTEALSGQSPRRIVDIGTGSGAGGLVAASVCPDAEIVLTDVNPRALRLARINAAAAGVEADLIEGAGIDPVPGSFDVALLNPPYIAGDSGPTYSAGGDMHGARLALDLSRAIVDRLQPGGRLLLYTGAPIVHGGSDPLRDALAVLPDIHLDYQETDPDVFGLLIGNRSYRGVERIAVVNAVLTRRG